LHRITARLKPELAQAEADARLYRVSPHLKLVLDMAGERAEELWNDMTTTQRHAVVGVLIERVRILPVTRRGPGFDPRSIEIVWRNAVAEPVPVASAARMAAPTSAGLAI
jgi:site-specific DNA recombinase